MEFGFTAPGHDAATVHIHASLHGHEVTLAKRVGGGVDWNDEEYESVGALAADVWRASGRARASRTGSWHRLGTAGRSQ